MIALFLFGLFMQRVRNINVTVEPPPAVENLICVRDKFAVEVTTCCLQSATYVKGKNNFCPR